jgi:hypothetical protein
MPSTFRVTTVSRESAFQVRVLHRARDRTFLGEQETGAHCDPGGAVGEGGREAAAVEEAAGSDHRNVDGVEYGRQQQGGRDTTGVSTAFAALDDHGVGTPARDLLGMPGSAHRRDDDDSVVLEPHDHLLAGGKRE